MVELIEEGSAEGVINIDEGEMLRSVLDFRRTLVREIMVPRTEMVCLEVAEGLEALIEKIALEGHSRVPVFEGDIDHVVGIIHARDILPFCGKSEQAQDLSKLMRSSFFVPETMNLETLLKEMNLRKTHNSREIWNPK